MSSCYKTSHPPEGRRMGHPVLFFFMRNTNKTKTRGNGSNLTLLSVMKRFSTEEAAIQYFEQIRWPDGPSARIAVMRTASESTSSQRTTPRKSGSDSTNGGWPTLVGAVGFRSWNLRVPHLCDSQQRVGGLSLCYRGRVRPIAPSSHTAAPIVLDA